MTSNLKLIFNSVEPGQNFQLVKFIGEFDKAGHAEVHSQLDACVKDFTLKFLIFDFQDLKFINSEGIGYLMEVHAHLAQRERKLVIIAPNDHVKDVFTAIGIMEIITVYNNLKDFLNNNP